MRNWSTVFLVLLLGGAGSEAHAQDVGKIFDLLQNQIQNEVNRKQQRRFERNRQKLFEAEQQAFNSAWDDCFQTDDEVRCENALAYPYLADADRARLLQRRAQIVAAQQAAAQAAEAVQREQTEREERERRAAEAEARRHEKERAAALERERQDSLARQREAEARARQAQESYDRKRNEQHAFDAALAGCQRYRRSSCDAAYGSPLASDSDRTAIESLRSIAIAYDADHNDCRQGVLVACDRALASPAASQADRAFLVQWRSDASPILRMAASVSALGTAALATTHSSLASFRDLPTSTHVMTAVASVLAVALALVAYRQRSQQAPGTRCEPQLANAPVSDSAETPSKPQPAPTTRSAAEPLPFSPPPVTPNLPATIAEEPLLPAIDTPAALKALAIADSYIAEVVAKSDDEDFPAHRTTLSLAARQLDIAAKADPNACLDDDEGNHQTQSALRARVLVQEALTWAAEKTAKACSIAEKACDIDPYSSHAHYVAGWLNFEHRNRERAIRLLERAVELSPANMNAVKLLDRAQNMSVTEIAAYKGQNAGLAVANAGVKVYNTGVGVYNVGVFFWNILVYILRLITLPYRIVDGIVRFLFR